MAAILGSKWFNKKIESKVAFGSTVERKLFPVHSNPTRLGIEQGLRGDPHRGPGCYDDDPVNLFLQPLNCQPRSTRGYGFGAAKSKREQLVTQNTDLGPGEYHTSISSEEPTKTSHQPFNAAESRFKEPPSTLNHLGPGSHDHDVTTDRRTVFDESFGAAKQLRKTITTKCNLGIPDKCCQCGLAPIGDYYESNKNQALCRPCYDQLSSSEGAVIRGMKKVRDCSSIHKHDFPGKTPKTIIKSDKEQKKLQYREAYMSLYYS